MGEKAEVTFRPEDSIILPRECNEDEPAEPVLGEGYVFPLGTFDSVLTGQGLVDRALSTAAELHAFASTHKRPPESHDACTNTDPASPHSDTGISAQPNVTSTASGPTDTSTASGPAALPPELFLNLQFPRDPPVHDTETSGEKRPERNTVRGLFNDKIEWTVQYTGTDHIYCFRHFMKFYLMVLYLSLPASPDAQGRQFINVIDLEDGALLQELPSCPAVRDHDVNPSPPTSAQLQLLAASVTNSAPSEVTADTSTEDDQPQAQPGGLSQYNRFPLLKQQSCTPYIVSVCNMSCVSSRFLCSVPSTCPP